METTPKIKTHRLLSVVVMGLWGLLVYSDTFHNSFHFDDYPQVIGNPVIKNIHDLHAIWDYYPMRFIAFFSFALNYYWGRADVFGYHVLSLVVHLGASLMVWWLVSLTLELPSVKKEKIALHAPWIAFWAGMIFLVHPLQTQPINYIYQRAVLWAAFFYLSSLALYGKARSGYSNGAGPHVWGGYMAASLLAAFLSMLSKEISVSLPVALWLYEFCFFKNKTKRSWAWVAPFFVLLLLMWASLYPELFKATFKDVETHQGGIPIWQYAMTQLKVVLIYIKLLFWPLHQTVEYDLPLATSFFQVPVMAGFLFWLLAIAAGVKLFAQYRLAAFGLFFFLLTLLPESSFWPTKDVIFEHRLYLPMTGFSIFFSSGIFYLCTEKKGSLAFRILLLIVLAFSVLAYQRNKVWASELTLWDDAVHQSPNSARAYLNRGAAYQKLGDLDHALADYNMVIGLGPIDAVTLSNRGAIFKTKGALDLALANFNLAIRIDPHYAGTYINRGLLYEAQGKLDLALADFNRAVEMMPDNLEAYTDRARVHFLLQKTSGR